MVLVTGGAGYIGSHTVVLLIEAGFEVVVYDNFCNSSIESIRRVEKIVGTKIPVIKGDIRDKERLQRVFDTYSTDSPTALSPAKWITESIEYVSKTLCKLSLSRISPLTTGILAPTIFSTRRMDSIEELQKLS